MQVTITRDGAFDVIAITRADGNRASFRFSRKGPVPHDAVHYFVESSLGMTKGFWGLVAAGHPPETVGEFAKAGGHASAKRANLPDAAIVELLQAERLVECFEAGLWSGTTEPGLFRSVAQTACDASHVPLPAISDKAIDRIAGDISNLHAQWSNTAAGHVFAFDWPDP